MGSIPQVCLTLRLFRPFAEVSLHHPVKIRMPSKMPLSSLRWRIPLLRFQRSKPLGSDRHSRSGPPKPAIEPEESSDRQMKSRFTLCAHFPCWELPRKASRGQRRTIRIARRPLLKLLPRRCGVPAIASPTFDGGKGRNSFDAFPSAFRERATPETRLASLCAT